MKTLLLIPFLALSVLRAAAQYSSRCSTDYFGNITCRSSDGGRLQMNRDYFGNYRSTYRDSYGNSSRCSSSRDYFGNITTRCY